MLKPLKSCKVKTQFIMLTSIFSILVILLGAYLFTNMNRILSNKVNASTQQVFNLVQAEISAFFQSIEMSANTLAYMQPIQDAINSKTAYSSYDSFNNMNQALRGALIANNNIKSILLDIDYTVSPFGDMELNLDDIRGMQIDSYKTYYSELLPFQYTRDLKALHYFAAVYRINNLRNLTSKDYAGNIVFILNKSIFDDISS